MMNTYSKFNVNSYGVQALSHSEMQEIDGGWIPIIVAGAAALMSGCASLKALLADEEPADMEGCPYIPEE